MYGIEVCGCGCGKQTIAPFPGMGWPKWLANGLYKSGIVQIAKGKNEIVLGLGWTGINPVAGGIIIANATKAIIIGSGLIGIAALMQRANKYELPFGREDAINEFLALVGSGSGFMKQGDRLVFVDLTGLLDDEQIASNQNMLDSGINSLPLSTDVCYCEHVNPGDVPFFVIPKDIKDFFGCAMQQASPLILDLNGDGVKTTALGPNFDYDNNGFAEVTGWVDPNDALLVRDLNGNGQIDDGSELFGNNTLLSNGQTAANGFEALADLDSNHDGIIDANDDAWNELRLWRDANGNGVVDADELLTLEEAGVAGLNTDYKNQSHTDENGNEHRQVGSFIRDDGTVADMTDVWFAIDPMERVELDPIEVSDAITALPDIEGSGLLYDLHQAMAKDESGVLQSLVEQFITESSISNRRALIEPVIFAWAGVVDFNAKRGPYIKEGKVVALEKFLAREFRQNGASATPGPGAAASLEEAFDILSNYVYGALALQSQYSDLYFDVLAEYYVAYYLELPFDVSSFIESMEVIYNDNIDFATELIPDIMESFKAVSLGSELVAALDSYGEPPRFTYDSPNAFDSFFASTWQFIIHGSDSVDYLFGKEGRDSYLFGEGGDDKIYGNSGHDRLYGGDGNDLLEGGAGDDWLYGDAGNDDLYGGAGNDFLHGGEGNDRLWGESGNDILHGGAGNDKLYGGNGNDILWGGAGDDRLEGGAGNDVYLFGRGDGHDTICELDKNRPSKRNIIQLGEGIFEDDIEFLVKPGANASAFVSIVIRIKDTGETLTIDNAIYDGLDNPSNMYSIQAIEFSDGTVWEWADILQKPMTMTDGTIALFADIMGSYIIGNALANTITGGKGSDILYGGAGDDTLRGGAGNDILWGGTGNDILKGGAGNDIYMFGRGDGHDIILEEENNSEKRNVIRLGEGITRDDIEFFVKPGSNASSFQDMVIRIRDTGETLTILNAIHNNVTNLQNYYSIQAIEFANGTVWEWDDIFTQPIMMADGEITASAETSGSIIYGNSLGNTIHGGVGNDILYGEAGNDILNGNGGNDILYGGSGNDTLKGGAGNDFLWGGEGDDRLEGGSGDDIYLFGRGDGHDIIADSENRTTKRNVIRLGEYITKDDIEFLISPYSYNSTFSDLIIRIKDTGETLAILQAIEKDKTNSANYNSIQAIEFSDGTIWEWIDILHRPLTMADGVANLTFVDIAGSYIIGNSGDNVITGSSAADTLYGGAGNDTLKGGAGNDTLWGGAGDDRLDGGSGDDIYLFGREDGHDVIADSENRATKRNIIRLGEGITGEDIEFLVKPYSYNSTFSDLIIRIKDTGETLTISQAMEKDKANSTNYNSIQAIEFCDGVVWEWEDVLRKPLTMADGVTNLTFVDITGSYVIGNSDNNIITGSSAADILYGGAGSDTIKSGGGNDILWGGEGDDRLEGGNGDDIYLFGRGDGHDVVYDYESLSRPTQRNIIRLREGIAKDDVEFLVKPATIAGNLNIIIRIRDTGETLTVERAIDEGTANEVNRYSIQAIEFSDGTIWEWADIIRQPMTMADGAVTAFADVLGSTIFGNELANTITGNTGNDILYGGSGNDMISGGSGDDVLHGDDGNDTLKGGAGNDILWGGAGDDRMEGGTGDDVYLFGRGDGHDVIADSENRTTKRNIIRLGEGIIGDDIEFLVKPYSGNVTFTDVIIRIKDTGETVTILKAIEQSKTNSANYNSIQAIEFSDGTVWEWADIIHKPMTMADGVTSLTFVDTLGSFIIGNSENNTITGSSTNDILYGGAGNDALNGGAGNDVLWGGVGNDTLNGGAGDDTYLFNIGGEQDIITDSAGTDSLLFGEGIEADDLWFRKSGNHLLIDVAGESDRVTITNWFNNNSYKVETISAGGMELVSTQMDQMIQAMASFGVPTGAEGRWTEDQKEGLAPIINTYWRPSGS